MSASSDSNDLNRDFFVVRNGNELPPTGKIKHGDMFLVKDNIEGKVHTFMVETETVNLDELGKLTWLSIGTSIMGTTTVFKMSEPDMEWQVLRGRTGWSEDHEVFHIPGIDNKPDDTCFVYLVVFNVRKAGGSYRIPRHGKEFKDFSLRSFSTRDDAYNYLRRIITIISEGTDDEKLEALLENPSIYSMLKHKTSNGDPRKIEQFEKAFDTGDIFPFKRTKKEDSVEIRKVLYHDAMVKSAAKR